MRGFITCTLRQIQLESSVKEDEIGRACSMNGEEANAYSILAGKPEGKSPLGRPRCKWVDIIKMDHRELGWGGMDWLDLA
jgi:hypothetical protein